MTAEEGGARARAERAFDVVIVGAGIAGLVAALDLLDADPHVSVAVVDKGSAGGSGSTPLAQGGMAAPVGLDDSPELHAADTLRAGDGLGDARAVAAMAFEVSERVIDLQRRGAVFDRGRDGRLALAREGGQTVARSVRTADATGAEIARALHTVGRERLAPGRFERLQGSAVSLVLGAPPASRVTGVWVLADAVPEGDALSRPQQAGLMLLRARAVLLATGGCGGLYAGTTNPDEATADGVALAWAAGAELVDLEFVQFHPTGLKAPGQGSWRFLLTEALRGAGAYLLDRDGRRFMVDRHPDAELAPRHVVTKGILDSGGAWLDATHIPADRLAQEFPTVLAGVRRHGFDLSRDVVPVEPCEHYMIGGVATDLAARSNVPGLWAAGEVACSGVHGANRMAGNSLAQASVFAHRAARSMLADLPPHEAGDPVEPALGSAGSVTLERDALRAAMTGGAGPLRTAEGLRSVLAALDAAAVALGPAPPADREGLELANIVTVGRLIAGSALLREESRGVHWREDHPGPSPEWHGRRVRLAGGDAMVH